MIELGWAGENVTGKKSQAGARTMDNRPHQHKNITPDAARDARDGARNARDGARDARDGARDATMNDTRCELSLWPSRLNACSCVGKYLKR